MSEIKWSEYKDSWLAAKQSTKTTANRNGSGKYHDDSLKEGDIK